MSDELEDPMLVWNEPKAQRDVEEAAGYYSDAITLKDQAQVDLEQATTLDSIGQTVDANQERQEAIRLATTAADYERRGNLLTEAGSLLREEVILDEERHRVTGQAKTADEEAAEAQARLKDSSLSETDKTAAEAEAGAATGQAAALHKRHLELTDEQEADRREADADRAEARKGMEGRPVPVDPGQGHPSGTKPHSS